MFPDGLQRDRFGIIAHYLWDVLYGDLWKQELGKHRRRNGRDPHDVLRQRILEDHPKWDRYAPLDRIDSGFPEAVIADYGAALDEAERAAFGPDELPQDIGGALRTTLRLFLSRAAFLGPETSGLVIARMGKTEPFPSLLFCRVGPVVMGRLKMHVFEHERITHDQTAMIIPFARHETIDMIIDGIHPGLAESLSTIMADSLEAHAGRKKATGDRTAVAVERFRENERKEISEKHSGPFMAALAALPRHDQAAMAEALVNLTAFRAHASAWERETVAGPIDVAILSKGDGFVWAKRKRFSAV
jgi:hypothetical protein